VTPLFVPTLDAELRTGTHRPDVDRLLVLLADVDSQHAGEQP
jgi:hypothetical protein